ncbi:YecA family protein [Kushneria phosphatilytica]|uniref:YecA family protein n=1 Tax=Kushneria phosphatilytica TaxID=657387 RepID=A0A1S1NY28_9GAMM|nr:YecA family protein [Kushneria phosphatilytica]OHV13455.1 hypothetical protein BH688_01160 [Kushneria phosphatilytica]QEL10541.1 YecA family protein [Kushneria phosphatilytica]
MAETPQPYPLLDDDQLDLLYDFLDSERVSDEALDLFGAHGYLVAQAITTAPTERDARLTTIFDTPPEFDDAAQQQAIESALEELCANAARAFEAGDVPDLPFDLDMSEEEADQEHPVRLWCAGFMEGVFSDETAWFGNYEAQAAELLLPFMILSGLFDEEDPELAGVGQDAKEATRLAEQLPELTLDLYLLYRAPAETPSKHHKPGAGPRSGKSQSRRRGR